MNNVLKENLLNLEEMVEFSEKQSKLILAIIKSGVSEYTKEDKFFPFVENQMKTFYQFNKNLFDGKMFNENHLLDLNKTFETVKDVNHKLYQNNMNFYNNLFKTK